MDKTQGGYLSSHIQLLNGSLFQKLLQEEPEALYRSEQGKILYVLWSCSDSRATATDIALATGLTNNTLTTMLKKLVEQGLVVMEPSQTDRRKKFVVLTDLGRAQEAIGKRLSQELGEIFYQGFSDEEIDAFEAYQERILRNLKSFGSREEDHD